jgi:hypothetical protein
VVPGYAGVVGTAAAPIDLAVAIAPAGEVLGLTDPLTDVRVAYRERITMEDAKDAETTLLFVIPVQAAMHCKNGLRLAPERSRKVSPITQITSRNVSLEYSIFRSPLKNLRVFAVKS